MMLYDVVCMCNTERSNVHHLSPIHDPQGPQRNDILKVLKATWTINTGQHRARSRNELLQPGNSIQRYKEGATSEQDKTNNSR